MLMLLIWKCWSGLERSANSIDSGDLEIISVHKEGDKDFPYRHTETVKAHVEAARKEHLDDRSQIKPNHISKVN